MSKLESKAVEMANVAHNWWTKKHKREPTTREMRRWAKLYRAVAKVLLEWAGPVSLDNTVVERDEVKAAREECTVPPPRKAGRPRKDAPQVW